MKQIATLGFPPSGWFCVANGAPVLRYEVENAGQVLHVEWQPGSPNEEVKLGFLEIVRLLQTTKCTVLLSDSNHFVGDWSELIPWVRYEFLPLALQQGLRYMADVLPIDPANSFSIYTWREETRGVVRHEVFSSLGAARQWVTAQLKAG
jgi:hypothetical protein